jgi:PPK2 family polyphosphate:nucleotide phosphotransferase
MGKLGDIGDRYRVPPGGQVRLKDWDPDDVWVAGGDKSAGVRQRESLSERLDRLQDLLYAQKKHRILVILQGMDTSGKDSTIRRVFHTIDPLGVRVANFHTPNADEQARDYLWRVHHQVPADGEIVIFNRSHYEDVLVPRAHGQQTRSEQQRRLEHIANFERLLAEEGTTLVKCFLHISFEEQRQRLQDRLDDPTKHWKFDYSDIREREHWDGYTKAYQDALAATSHHHAPWYVIPANHKWVRDLVISAILVHTLEGLRMRYPPPPEGLDKVRFD